MNLKDIEQYKIFEVIGGSISYGTNTSDSDVDLRGIFALPPRMHLSMLPIDQQVNDDTNDTTFYELKRYFQLASECNPNIIELLWTPSDCLRKVTPIMQKILDNRDLFISKKAYHTFSGYAHSQIKRAKGQNKWINNPQPKEPPDKLGDCWIIPISQYSFSGIIGQSSESTRMPFRPFAMSGINLDEYNCAKMEHMENTYRLYWYGSDAKGVFRGPNQELIVESIPKEDEWKKFAGLLIYNEQEYNAAYKDWVNYHDWLKNRNEARYRLQEAGEIDYDAKNVMHCMRLLWSGENILKNGCPIVRFEGEQRQILLDIRNGKFAYEDVIAMVEAKKADLDILKDISKIPDKVNIKKIDNLYQNIMNELIQCTYDLVKVLYSVRKY